MPAESPTNQTQSHRRQPTLTNLKPSPSEKKEARTLAWNLSLQTR